MMCHVYTEFTYEYHIYQVVETMLLRTPNQALRTSPLVVEAAGLRYNIQTMHFLYLGRSCRRKRRGYARNQTTAPTRMGMLQTVQAGASCTTWRVPVHSKGAPAKDRGGGDRAVRVRDLDSRPGALH